jgi:hypothetical protein
MAPLANPRHELFCQAIASGRPALLRTQQIDYLIVQDLGEMVGSCARSLAMIGESAFRVNNSRANGRDVPGGARYGNFFYEFRS